MFKKKINQIPIHWKNEHKKYIRKESALVCVQSIPQLNLDVETSTRTNLKIVQIKYNFTYS